MERFPFGAAENIDNQVKQEWHQHYNFSRFAMGAIPCKASFIIERKNNSRLNMLLIRIGTERYNNQFTALERRVPVMKRIRAHGGCLGISRL